MNVSSSRLRTMMLAINLDKTRKRRERIEVYNNLQDQYNDWAYEHKELAFVVPSKNIQAEARAAGSLIDVRTGRITCRATRYFRCGMSSQAAVSAADGSERRPQRLAAMREGAPGGRA